jgi:hypothetical protein
MRYLTNDRNIVRDAALTASNIVASHAIYRTDEDAKQGGGQITLTGDYSGAEDTTVDIKIFDETVSGTPKVSAPIFSGVGNGKMTDLSATSSVAAQTFVVVLEDLGTATVKAYAPFAGVTLRAQASGTPGNLITLSVDNSLLTRTPTQFALQHDLAAVTNEYTGDEWDFGAAVLNPDLTIPDTAPRVSFGADPQVYRAYKFYRDGHYIFGFSDVVSVYDALNGIRAASTLIEVVGAIVNDKTSGGQGATDLSVWTSAYQVGLGNSGGDQVAHAELLVTPSAAAPTETLTIKVIDATQVGAERWSVRGDVSGSLANAITNVLYADGDYTFKIPPPVVDTNAPPGTIVVTYQPISVGRDGGDPQLCSFPALLGSAARDGVWEFEYRRRPTNPCDCTTGDLEGGPNDTCLGITPDGGEIVSDESRLIRLQRLTTAVRGFIGDNTPPYPTLEAGSSPIDTDAVDIRWINKTAAILKDALTKAASYTPLAVWQPSHAYDLDQMRESINRSGYRFAVTSVSSDKLSGGSEPAWVNTVGSTTTDNHVTWTCIGKTPFLMWDDMFAQWKVETAALASIAYGRAAATEWAATTIVAVGAVVRPSTANRNGHLYLNPSTLTTGASEPSPWPTLPRGVVANGNGTLIEFLQYWKANTVYKLGAIATPGDGYTWVVTTEGTSDVTTEPNWFTAGNGVNDGSVVWTRTAGRALTVLPVDEYFDRYSSMSNDIAAAAGTDPTFSDAGRHGDDCWQDFGDSDFWWEFTGTELYLPAQTGHYYHSAKLVNDPITGQQIAQSSKEFAFALRFGCPANLQEGDKIQVTISGNVGTHGYADGDQFTVPIIHAIPLPFGGGQTGNDTLKFHVSGSVAGAFPEYNLLTAAAPPARVNSHVYAIGDRYTPAIPNGRFYECIAPGAAAGSPPVFTTNRTSYTDGAATFIDMGGVSSYSDSGLAFDITPGGIDFALGDKFTFVIEGGHFKLSFDGGISWSSATVIADTVDLTAFDASLAGVIANFTGGVAPSWKTNDRWTFLLEAVNGVDGLRQPTDARTAWTGSTAIVITPGATKPADCVLIGDHTIPSDATITLLGSDDNFSTTPFSQIIPWQQTHIYLPLTNCNRAKYKVTVDKGGDLSWLWLGNGLDLKLPNGVVELGRLTKRYRMPSQIATKSLSGNVEHSGLTQASVTDLVTGLAHACQFDDQRLGIVPNENETEIGIVAFAADSLDVTDDPLLQFQPRDTKYRLLSVTLQLAAVA